MSTAANMNSVPQSIIAPNTPVSDTIVATNTPVIPTESTATPEKIAADKLTSTRFAQLSKKEAALFKEKEALKKEREEFNTQQTEAVKYRRAWEMVNEIAELQKTDAVAAMRKAGFTDADLMNFLAQNEDTSTPEEKVVKLAKGEIDKFKSEQAKLQEEADKKEQSRKQAEMDKSLAKFKTDIGSQVKLAGEKYEYCNFYGEQAVELIYETVASVLNDSNEMIGIDEAAQMVEDWYEEQDKSMNSLKKRTAHLAPKKELEVSPANNTLQTSSNSNKIEPKRVESKQFVDNRVPTKTLTNKLTPTISSSVIEHMTPEQNKQRILEKFMSIKR